MNEVISILTDPITSQFRKFYRKIRNRQNLNKEIKYGGHPAVTRSLIMGLNETSYKFNYNVENVNDLYENVIVLSTPATVEQAIQLKNEGKIKKLFVGPNISVSPLEDNRILCSSAIDKCIVPSEWIKNFYVKVAPELKNKIVIWPAGVDEKEWHPTEVKKEKTVLFFYKRPVEEMYQKCKELCQDHGYKIIELVYSVIPEKRYTVDNYKDGLNKSMFNVYFVEQESQGIALTESWSMNVPTIVWNPGYWQYKGANYKCSSAPYLTKENGEYFLNELEFENIVNKFNSDNYSSRDWVLKNMTDKICAEKLIYSLLNK